ncbi:transcriptional regulator, TetR family [Micromonospora pattaloongensis]|uniref:Transcriptional regulator, TetR family n=1 Tax=Micromonospora pattaloongensis TaxID=405436 RepID=A0A1H3KC42_9ACTN|nr:transcriptional regulator, TetR family [Micromonospora pattaloongensis]
MLAAAVEVIGESGTSGLSLRDLARRAGVSHAAPAYHFGDKEGLLTALASQGYELLADALEAARGAGGEILEVGLAYVRFAVDHPAHFKVMFQPDLYPDDDPTLAAARQRAAEALRAEVTALPGVDPQIARLAAWSIVHGFATLWLGGALRQAAGQDDATDLARPVIRLLFGHDSDRAT